MLKLIQLASSEVALSAEFMEAANADQLPPPPPYHLKCLLYQYSLFPNDFQLLMAPLMKLAEHCQLVCQVCSVFSLRRSDDCSLVPGKHRGRENN